MLCAKRTQQWWPTTPNTVGCYILHLFAHPVACCWELLRKVWNRSNLKLCANGRNNSQQCSVCLHGALHLTPFLFHWQVIHLKRFQLVNNHWVKSNKTVQFPMEGFDPSAFLAKPSSQCQKQWGTGERGGDWGEERSNHTAGEWSEYRHHSVCRMWQSTVRGSVGNQLGSFVVDHLK